MQRKRRSLSDTKGLFAANMYREFATGLSGFAKACVVVNLTAWIYGGQMGFVKRHKRLVCCEHISWICYRAFPVCPSRMICVYKPTFRNRSPLSRKPMQTSRVFPLPEWNKSEKDRKASDAGSTEPKVGHHPCESRVSSMQIYGCGGPLLSLCWKEKVSKEKRFQHQRHISENQNEYSRFYCFADVKRRHRRNLLLK